LSGIVWSIVENAINVRVLEKIGELVVVKGVWEKGTSSVLLKMSERLRELASTFIIKTSKRVDIHNSR
jgi:lysophospholipid acyltransferase (LPLAT)-like uncharacterized protein